MKYIFSAILCVLLVSFVVVQTRGLVSNIKAIREKKKEKANEESDKI